MEAKRVGLRKRIEAGEKPPAEPGSRYAFPTPNGGESNTSEARQEPTLSEDNDSIREEINRLREEIESLKKEGIPFEKSKQEFASWLSSISTKEIKDIRGLLKKQTPQLPSGTDKEKIYEMLMPYFKGELKIEELKEQIEKGERIIEEVI